MYPLYQGLPAATGIGSVAIPGSQFANASQMNSEPF
jgi:hypothetical protein